MTLSDYNSEEDDDYSLSEAETEDSLEYASETERTKAEDDLAEHKVRYEVMFVFHIAVPGWH